MDRLDKALMALSTLGFACSFDRTYKDGSTEMSCWIKNIGDTEWMFKIGAKDYDEIMSWLESVITIRKDANNE